MLCCCVVVVCCCCVLLLCVVLCVLLTGQPQGLAARVPGVLAIPHEGWQRDASRSWSSSSWNSSSFGSLMTSARCSAPKEAPLWHSLSQQCRSVLFSGSIPTSFVCSFCGASVFLFSCLPTLAGGAVFLRDLDLVGI